LVVAKQHDANSSFLSERGWFVLEKSRSTAELISVDESDNLGVGQVHDLYRRLSTTAR